LFIIFDLDDTLIDTSASITPFQLEKALKFVLHKIGREHELIQAYSRLLELDQNASSGEAALKVFLENYGVSENLLEEAVAVFQSMPDPECPILPMEQAHDVIQTLRFHRLAIVTIGKEALQYHKLKKAGFDPTLFSKIIVAAEKNKKNHYSSLLELYNESPCNTLVIGDRLMIDLQPAKELGCRTVHFLRGRGLRLMSGMKDGNQTKNTDGSCVVDHTIKRMQELVAIVEKHEGMKESLV
jgi:putative hydrolase of the HAD superfamily